MKKAGVVLAVLGVSAAAWATEFAWTVAGNTQNETDVRTEGRILYAYAPRETTVNGVTFKAVPNGKLFPKGIVFAIPVNSNAGAFWHDPESRWHGSEAYRRLLSNAFYSWHTFGKRQSATLCGLTPGRRYLVQLWFCDMREVRRKSCQFIGGKVLPMSDGGNDFGANAVGTFVASGTEQRFDIVSSVEDQINAIQVRDLDDWSAEASESVLASQIADCPLARFNPTWTNGALGITHTSMLPTAALLGNGALGVVNGETAGGKLFVLTRGDLWSCGALETNRGKHPERDILPISFADFTIESGADKISFSDTLDLSTATLETRGSFGDNGFLLRSFVAADEDTFVVSGVARRDAVWKLRLKAHDGFQCMPTEAVALKDGIGIRRRTMNLAGACGWETNATAVVKAVGAKIFRTAAVSALETVAEVRLFAGQRFAFVVSTDRRPVDTALVNNLRRAHLAWWKEWYDRCRIHLNDELLERYYYGALYILGSGVRSGKFPPGIYGPWVTTDTPGYQNDYHLNYNYISTYYGCYAANRPEIADAMIDPLLAYLPRARRNAKCNLGKLERQRFRRDSVNYVRGRKDLAGGIDDAALFPVSLGPWGVSSVDDTFFLCQTLNGAFSAAAACTYWDYTLDRNYLRKAWPLLDKVANFYLSWCARENTADGGYRYVLWDGWCEDAPLVKNCAETLGCARYLFETLVSVAPTLRELGLAVPAEKVAKWRDFAAHLSALPTGLTKVAGRDLEVFSNAETGTSRAQFGTGGGFELESAIPGEAFAFDATARLKAVATNTVHAKIVVSKGETWSSINQTPKLYATAIRVGYPAAPIIAAFKEWEIARRERERGGFKNLTLNDGHHGIEKVGAIEFINSMLIQSDHGFVKVFPNWIGTDASFERLRAKGAFVVSSELRGGAVRRVTVTSEKGGVFRLVDPFAGKVADFSGLKRGTTRYSKEPTLEFEMRPGETRDLVPAAAGGMVDAIDPMIGSVTYPEDGLRGQEGIHGFGKTFPGATTPFGTVQLSPDTVTGGDNGPGYSYAHKTIEGFSFTHMSGIGWYGEFGNLQVMPSDLDKSRFSHSEERAEAGYYRVRLKDAGVVAEATAARRSGMLRFTWEKPGEGVVRMNLARRIGELARVKRFGGQSFRMTGERTFAGEIACDHRDGGWGRGAGGVDYCVRFAGRLSLTPNRVSTTGGTSNCVVRMTFPVAAGDSVVLHVALSFDAPPETPSDLDFDAMRRSAGERWAEALSGVAVEGGTARERTIFATALYHAFIDPREIGCGTLRGHPFVRRTIFSGWDVFRSAFPLYTLLRPDVVSDTINSMMDTVVSGKRKTLPRWDIFGCPSGCMIGQPLVSVMADAWEKGIRTFDGKLALDLARRSLEAEGNDRRLGCTPGRLSDTLEYAYADWCCGRLAEMLGEKAVARRHFDYAKAYTNCWSKEVGWMRARTADGGWLAWKGRETDGQGCVEANPWQQGWFVPHDVEGLVSLMGGRGRFTAELEKFFGVVPDDFRWNPAYNHPNEPCHTLPYLFAFSEKPEEVGRWTRRICETAYGTGPFGLCGNEDVGQMSAWYVLSAIGLHPVCPGDGRWYVTAPVFRKTTIRLDPKYYPGGTFAIRAPNAGPGVWRVAGLRLNGKPLSRRWVSTREVASGGVLEIDVAK